MRARVETLGRFRQLWQSRLHDLTQHMQLRRIIQFAIPPALAAFNTLHAADAPPQADNDLPPAATRKVDFAKDLQPLFVERCYDCHGEKKQESAFRADNRADLLKGGDTGPSLIVGKSAESILVQVLAGVHEDLAQMPKKKEKFTDEQIGLVRAWIDQGAEWAEGATAKSRYNTNHWAFKAPVRPAVPGTANQKWGRTPIDFFVLARLEKEKLTPSPEADKITLLRRLSLDLIGLPPRPAEV